MMPSYSGARGRFAWGTLCKSNESHRSGANQASGLALLRVLDPHFETPVAEDLVYAGGVALFTTIPILLIANIPAIGYAAGRSVPASLQTIALAFAYLVAMFLFWLIYHKIYLLRTAGEKKD